MCPFIVKDFSDIAEIAKIRLKDTLLYRLRRGETLPEQSNCITCPGLIRDVTVDIDSEELEKPDKNADAKMDKVKFNWSNFDQAKVERHKKDECYKDVGRISLSQPESKVFWHQDDLANFASKGPILIVGEGIKNDADKNRLDLIPPIAIEALGQVLTDGAKKYGDYNWEKGMKWSRPYGAMQRHLQAWWGGEDKDKESGHSHLWHAFCECMFLICYENWYSENDDRRAARCRKNC